MNKEYAYVDGKVIVCDENGKLIQRNYRENIDEILVQENVVEKIEKDIKELEEEVNNFNKEKRVKFPFITLSVWSLSSLVTWFVLSIGLPFDLISIIFLIAIQLPLLIIGPSFDKVLIFDPLKKHKGNISKLEYLKKVQQGEREILSEIQKNTELREDKIEEVTSVTVDDKQIMASLKSEEYLYYDVGANLKKYYLLYQKGKLADKLAKYYNQKGVEIATEYVKENGPKLVRKN